MSIKSFVDQHAKKPRGRTIAIWRGVGGRESIYTEAIIGLALKLRGYKTKFVLCDRVMSGCIQGGGVGVGRQRCQGCWRYATRILDDYGLPYVNFSELVPKGRRRKFRNIVSNIPYDKIESCKFHNTPVGVFAKESLIRHLRGDSIRDQQLLREFLFSSLVCLDAARVYYHRERPTQAIFQRHFEYVGWGPAYYYFASNKDVDVIAWQGSLDLSRQITMMHCKGDFPVVFQAPVEVWEKYKNTSLTSAENQIIDKRLKLSGVSKKALLQQLGIQDTQPIWCLFPHMSWDMGLSPLQWPFDGAEDWLFTSIRAMLDTPGVTWLLKAHPGERHNTARGIIQTVKEKFPEIEKQIVLIPPTSKLRPADLSLILSGGITLQGTIAIELSSLGIPMIVGNSKYPGKEFVYSGATKEEYIDLIHKTSKIKPLSPEARSWARRFANLVYIHKKLPLRVTAKNTGYKPIVPGKIQALLPGKDVIIDMICNDIVHGGEFIR